MNGAHDLGGMDGLGKVVPGPEEEVPFHAPWEGRVLAMTRALQGAKAWNIDQFRYRIEQLPPHVYLAATYYQKWFLQDEYRCLELGLVTAEELAAGQALEAPKPLKGVVRADDIERVLIRPCYERPANAGPKFAIGERVRARNIHPKGHTRLPRFVRGHFGTVDRIQGHHAFPDSIVADGREDPQWLYTVKFDGRELWGEDAEPNLEVSVEAFEPYLETV